MQILRTPEARFAVVDGLDHTLGNVTVSAPDVGAPDALQMAYVDEGPPEAPPVVLVHGEPTWSFLYRHMIGPLVDAGLRAVVPDLIGFGRSDKPRAIADHTYARHVAWTWRLVEALDLDTMTWVGQDWGGLIGLRLLAAHPERFACFVAANTALPSGDQNMPEVWHAFRRTVNTATDLDIARLVQAGTQRRLSDAERAAYDAPFPDESYKAGPRAMPEMVPYRPDHPAAEDNRRAWKRLTGLDVPVVTAFSDGDPIMAGVDRVMQRAFPGAQGQPHTTIVGAGHYLQEDAGPQLAAVVADAVLRHT
ncbi:MAG TPA: haloalkane dehalogenase [Euzebyales bacterium]|nr:haloalkane dehalogenase [Euzebyales bacterium]